MAGRGGSGSGAILLGGLVLLVAMCRGGGDRTADKPVQATLGPVPAYQAPAQPEPMQVVASALNQRMSPNGAVVGRLTGGAAVEVYARDGGRARISPDGASPRWVSVRQLCAGLGCYRPPAPRRHNTPARRSRPNYLDGTCPCSGDRVCIGPRGGRYCITSGGNKRYGV